MTMNNWYAGQNRAKQHRVKAERYTSSDKLNAPRYRAALRVLERANKGESLIRFGNQSLADAIKLAVLGTGWYGADVCYYITDEIVARTTGKDRSKPSPVQSFRYELRRMLDEESWDIATFELSARSLATHRKIEYADAIIKAELRRYMGGK